MEKSSGVIKMAILPIHQELLAKNFTPLMWHHHTVFCLPGIGCFYFPKSY